MSGYESRPQYSGILPNLLGLSFAALLSTGLASAQAINAQQAGATVAKYCATCHSPKLHTADFVLDPSAVAQPETDADHWERVIRKLRARSMPPSGAPRPADSTYTELEHFIEQGIDAAAAAHPNPGKLPLLHRLSRAEYQNAVRDLLALDALPREMDLSLLLPADNVNSGFDNIADLLFISPTAMEAYLGAAEKISRLAIGDPAFPVMVNIHRLPDEEPQSERMPGMPPGTRGGLAIHTDFPLDGEYLLKVTLAGTSEQQQQLEVAVDGARVQLASVGGAPHAASMRRASASPDDPGVSNYGKALEEPKPVEFRIPVKAGSRVVRVAFIERNELRDEEVLRPRWRSTGPELAIEKVTLSGPYNGKGPGDTASRRRIFVCHPATASDEEPCARRILSTLERRAYRRPVTAKDVAVDSNSESSGPCNASLSALNSSSALNRIRKARPRAACTR
jgi:mono/diheme cytochrome c family protein